MKRLLLALAMFAISAAAYGQQAPAAGPTHFRLCTGASTLNYYKAGQYLKKHSTSVPIDVIETKGSIDNLDHLIAGDCDGAFVQADAMLVYANRNAKSISQIERAGVLYQEQAHMLCNRKANLGNISYLTKDMTVAIGPDGTGAHTTWDAFVLANKARYGGVRTDERSGQRALAAVSDGTDVTCALVITALNSAFVKEQAQKLGDNIVLINTDDSDMPKVAKDGRGQPVYKYSEIPADTYPKVQPSGTVYGTKKVGTIAIEAIFVASTGFISGHEKEYDKVLSAFSNAKPDIAKLAEPQ